MALAGAAAVIAWFMRTSYSDIKEKQRELSKEVSEVKLQYLHKEEFKEFKQAIETKFDRLNDSLDTFREEFRKHEVKELELQAQILDELRKR